MDAVNRDRTQGQLYVTGTIVGLRSLDASGNLSPAFDEFIALQHHGSGDGGGECIAGMNRSGREWVIQLHGKESSGSQDSRPQRSPEGQASSQFWVGRDGRVDPLAGRGWLNVGMEGELLFTAGRSARIGRVRRLGAIASLAQAQSETKRNPGGGVACISKPSHSMHGRPVP